MITIILVAITALTSYMAFRSPVLMSRYDFSPFRIVTRREYYRFITHAFLHADWIHLLVNMIVLFSFGVYVESELRIMQNSGEIKSSHLSYLLLYLSSLLISSFTTFLRKKDDPYYIAVGASGAVSAVVFASIFFSPLQKILLFGVLPLPGIVFGIFYLGYSHYMSRKDHDNINHDAHLWGALYGLFFPLLLEPSLLFQFIHRLGF